MFLQAHNEDILNVPYIRQWALKLILRAAQKSVITMLSKELRHLKSSATSLYVQQLVPANNIEYIKTLAAFLVTGQRFPYRSRFNFSVKNMENMLLCNTVCDIMHIDFSRKIYLEQMMHPLAFNRSSLSQMKAHKMWMFGMFWNILRQ